MRPARAAIACLTAVSLLAAGCGSASGSGSKTTTGATLVESSGVWAPDSHSIARVGAHGIEIADAGGQTLRSIPVRTPSRGIGWSGDGRRVLFLSKEPDQKPDRSERVGSVAATGGPISWRPLGTHAGSLSWSPEGWPLFFATTYLYVDVFRGPVGPRAALWVMSGPGDRPKRILDMPGEERYPVISPDGGSVLFTLERERRGASIWTARLDGSGRRQLVHGLGSGEASWSPDSSQVAVAGVVADAPRGDRRQHLYVVPADGGPPRRLSDDELRVGERPAWTPDGEWITYATYDGEVKRVRPDGTGLETIADFPGQEVRDLAWSPDGTHLSYTAQPIIETD